LAEEALAEVSAAAVAVTSVAAVPGEGGEKACKAVRLQGYKATWLQGHRVTRLHGYRVAGLQGYKVKRDVQNLRFWKD